MTHDKTLLIGCGRLGSAILTGWLAHGPMSANALMIQSPTEEPALDKALAAGATRNPGAKELAQTAIAVLAVKPAIWRAVAADLAETLSPDAIVVSVMAGVEAGDIQTAFGGRRVARVMPTTGVSTGRGVASIWSADAEAAAKAQTLFGGIATTVDLPNEDAMHAATALSGSGQAYFFAFVEALAKAGEAQGLDPATAASLGAATLSSAAAGMEAPGATTGDLIAQVASPGGTTRAALDAFARDGALDRLVEQAVQAAVDRSRELSAS